MSSTPQPHFQTLIHKVMSDDEFASALASDPQRALQGAGITPTAELLEALKGVDVAAIRKLASTFKEGQAAGG